MKDGNKNCENKGLLKLKKKKRNKQGSKLETILNFCGFQM